MDNVAELLGRCCTAILTAIYVLEKLLKLSTINVLKTVLIMGPNKYEVTHIALRFTKKRYV